MNTSPAHQPRRRAPRRSVWLWPRAALLGLAMTAVSTSSHAAPSPTATPAPTATATPAAVDPQVAAVQALQMQLLQQLATVQTQQGGNAAAVAAVQLQMAGTQTQLIAAQATLDQANQRLARTQVERDATQAQLKHNRALLAPLVASWYMMQNSGSMIHALVQNQSFSNAVDAYTALQQLGDRMAYLVRQTQDEQTYLGQLHAQQASDQQIATAAVTELQSLDAQQATQAQAYQSQASDLSGQAASLTAQLQALELQVGGLQLQEAIAAGSAAGASGQGTVGPGAYAPYGLGPRVNLFPWGQCTWYVASLRDVTWSGNAADWAANAKAQAKPEGLIPQIGAIVVWGAGNGYSAFGHVAYVTSVQSATAFTVDEANYAGLGVADQRAVPSLRDVLAFIY